MQLLWKMILFLLKKWWMTVFGCIIYITLHACCIAKQNVLYKHSCPESLFTDEYTRWADGMQNTECYVANSARVQYMTEPQCDETRNCTTTTAEASARAYRFTWKMSCALWSDIMCVKDSVLSHTRSHAVDWWLTSLRRDYSSHRWMDQTPNIKIQCWLFKTFSIFSTF